MGQRQIEEVGCAGDEGVGAVGGQNGGHGVGIAHVERGGCGDFAAGQVVDARGGTFGGLLLQVGHEDGFSVAVDGQIIGGGRSLATGAEDGIAMEHSEPPKDNPQISRRRSVR